jgi:hypothetical protein
MAVGASYRAEWAVHTHGWHIGAIAERLEA